MRAKSISFLIVLMALLMLFPQSAAADSLSISEADKDKYIPERYGYDSMIRMYSCAFIEDVAAGRTVDSVNSWRYCDPYYICWLGSDHASPIYTRDADGIVREYPAERAVVEFFLQYAENGAEILKKASVNASVVEVYCFCQMGESRDQLIWYVTDNGDYMLFKESCYDGETYLLPYEAFKDYCDVRYKRILDAREGKTPHLYGSGDHDPESLYDLSPYELNGLTGKGYLVFIIITVVCVLTVTGAAAWLISGRKNNSRMNDAAE